MTLQQSDAFTQLDMGFSIMECGLTLTVHGGRQVARRQQQLQLAQLCLVFMPTRVCKACGEEKSVEDFVRNGRWFRYVCKPCWASQARVYEHDRKNLDGLEACKRINRLWPAPQGSH